MGRKLTLDVACLVMCSCAQVLAAEQVVLRGCLLGDQGNLYLATVQSQSYKLTGNTAGLTKYMDKEISIEGSVNESIEPSFAVAGLRQVFDVPQPTLNASFADSSLWQHETNSRYGITYAHPPAWDRVADSESNMVQPNFAGDKDAVILAIFRIPGELYPKSSFVDGAFGVFVNPRITNAQSCARFGREFPGSRSSHRVGGVEYSAFEDVGAAAGTAYDYRDFHTFRNGLCYQISFELAEWNTRNSDIGCTIPSLGDPEELKIVDRLLGAISFLKSAKPVLPTSAALMTPRVVDFKASSETADTTSNRGLITFSWQAENADYVELSYKCFPAPKGGGVVISEGIPRECENNTMPRNGDMKVNYSPYSSAAVSFGNFVKPPKPISVIAMLTPFSHAIAYPGVARYVTISVTPHSPFPNGAPSLNGNITLRYSPGVSANGSYQQGSAVTIEWEDKSSLSDKCVNLYLAQSNANRPFGHRIHVGDACLTPARAGSYKWTIPSAFSGPEYQIFATTPGSTSSGSGPAFAIIPRTRR